MSKSFSILNRLKSFRYAFNGLKQVIIHEYNFRIHLFATVVVIFLGFYFNVSQSEWLWLVLAIGIVLIIEVVNTAIEKLVDIQFPTLNPKAGIIKDIAAAGVLLAAATALIIGAIIFYKYIF